MRSLRIVSLVPSLTETICDLGLKDNLVGATQYCTHPAGLHKRCKIIGGTKNPDLNEIKSLKPTHILMNKEENTKKDFLLCKEISEIFLTDVKKVTDVVELFRRLGSTFGVTDLAKKYELEILDLINRVRSYEQKFDYNAIYYIWKNPWMVASKDTYISDVLNYYGINNIIGYDPESGASGRYPEIKTSQIDQNPVDIDMFSSEPWPFRSRDVESLSKELKRRINSFKVDGKVFSWFGSTTLVALRKAIDFRENGLAEFKRISTKQI